MTNQDFCYWLQGYFEISRDIVLDKDRVLLIKGSLQEINEPFGDFMGWLAELVVFFSEQLYRKELLAYFLPEIINRLNSIFLHVIDNSYDMTMSNEEAKKIHDGVAI